MQNAQETSLSRQYKLRFKKKAKLTFLQSGQSMMLVEKLKFFHDLCLSKIDREKVFGEVLDKMKLLKTIKTTVYEKRKIRIFPKVLIHRFCQKFKSSSTLIFMQNRPRKSIWERSSQEKVSIILCNPLSARVTPCNPL